MNPWRSTMLDVTNSAYKRVVKCLWRVLSANSQGVAAIAASGTVWLMVVISVIVLNVFAYGAA